MRTKNSTIGDWARVIFYTFHQNNNPEGIHEIRCRSYRNMPYGKSLREIYSYRNQNFWDLHQAKGIKMSASTSTLVDFHGIKVTDDSTWEIGGYERTGQNGDDVTVHIQDLNGITCQQLKEILLRLEELEYPMYLDVLGESYSADEDFEYIMLGQDDVRFSVSNNQLEVQIPCSIHSESEITLDFLIDRIAPLINRKNLKFTEDEYSEYDPIRGIFFSLLSLSTDHDSYLCSQFMKDAQEVQALANALGKNGLTPLTLADIVRSGQPEALLGQTENQWLEIKSEHFYPETPKGKFRFLRSVVQFANTGDGGILLLGAKTESGSGVDVIEKITPLPLSKETSKRKEQYKSALADAVFPPIKNLSIEEIQLDGGSMMMFLVPPQPEELKPFLIHGVEEDGKKNNQYISFVERHGDTVYTYTPQSIHSMLAAGKALLRGTK